MAIRIDRCVCYQKTFTELLQIAEEKNCQDIPSLQKQVLFGQKCQMCHPYVEAMLTSKQTVFHELLRPNPGK